mgnify:FL=1
MTIFSENFWELDIFCRIAVYQYAFYSGDVIFLNDIWLKILWGTKIQKNFQFKYQPTFVVVDIVLFQPENSHTKPVNLPDWLAYLEEFIGDLG